MNETLKHSFTSSILDVLPDAIIWVQPVFGEDDNIEDFLIEYSNHTADIAINHPKGSLTGLQILKDGVPSKESAEGNFQHFLDVYSTGELKEYTFFAHHSNKHYETVRRLHEGGVLSTTRDRKEQRQAEKREKEKTLLLNGIVENAPTGIMVYESLRNSSGQIDDFEVRLYNKVLHQLTNVSEEERIALTFRQLLTSLGSMHVYEKYVRTVERGEPFIHEYLSPRNGKWLNLSVVKLGDGFLIMVSDISQIKDLQVALERTANRLKKVLDTSQAGMFTLNPIKNENSEIVDFRFGLVNQAVASYIKESAEVLTGNQAIKYFPAYKTNGLFELYKDTLLTGASKTFDFHYEDGYNKYFSINVEKIEDEVLVTFTDHTDLKSLQKELEQKVVELERSNTSLEEFAYAASHDLQEPLRKISTFSDRLKEELLQELNDTQKKMFERISSASNRMRHLIDDLLSYSQVTATGENNKSVDLNNVVQLVIQDLETIIVESGAIIKNDNLPVLLGDERQLRQMFQNLLSNSLKYRHSHISPEILIKHFKISGQDTLLDSFPHAVNQQYHVIQVKDNGIGFEQENAERIFQVFQRLHGRAEYEGTGIGLAIVQKVVTNHKGYITVESEPGKGSTFNIILPADS